MKISGIFALILVLCGLMLCSCKYIPSENGNSSESENINNSSESLENNGAVDNSENNTVDVPDEGQSETKEMITVEDFAKTFFAEMSQDGGEYFEDAKVFCEALVNKDYETIAYYTGGKSEYYTFLDDCVIEECVLTPVSIPAEKQQEIMEKENVYLSASDLYFLTLSVIEAGETGFVAGDNIYFLGFDINPVSGNVLSFIVPAKDAEKVLFGSFERDYLKTFVSEFVSLYDGITDGRNDPSDFDFMNVRGVHLITHLMARSKVYREYPPYTLEEVNSFIMQSFENNNGIEFDDDRDYDVWINGQNFEDDRVYGCSYGHGGTTAKHRIMSVQNDGNSVTVNVTVYADYSNFAKAKDMVLYFEKLDNGLLKLCGVEQLNNTGRSPAILSI